MNFNAMQKLTCGVYVVSSRNEDMYNGQICNTVFQVTSKPACIAISINKENLTHQFIMRSKLLSVTVLDRDTPISFVGHFGFKSGRDIDKFVGTKQKLGETGVPIVLDNGLAYLEGKVIKEIDVGTHSVFVAEVVAADVLKEGEPLTYSYYHEVKKGSTPKTAPSYIDERKEHSSGMASYRCKVCGYVYDPKAGDPENGIEPNTPFENVPDDWVCPVCGASKMEFEKIE